MELGDGVARHPTQAYEIAFLITLGLVLRFISKRPLPNGILFRVFTAADFGWRLLIVFLQPQPLTGGLNAIQWACCAGLAAVAVSFLGYPVL